MTRRNLTPVGLSILLLLGCAAQGGGGGAGRGWQGQRPQLYPNARLQEVGFEQAQYDIQDCMARADYGATQDSVAAQGAVNTLGGAAAGAALGAIGGAIAGDAGTGAAGGAAIGGTAGVAKTVGDSRRPQENYRGFVDACLRERGYEVTGWR